jgi:BlaI family transcriptional regulator, penicillinase repressor
MAGRSENLPALSEAQNEIMEIVWARGEISASEVRTVLNQRRKVSRNTVRTLLERMEEKGWLTHREEGRTHLYSPVRSRGEAMGQKVVEMLDRVCGGEPETLMAALIDYRGLDASELKRIQSLLEAAKTRKRRLGDHK